MCFNGAAAFQPRKVPARDAVDPREATASMGPRLFSRGKGIECRRCGCRDLRFNGAAAFQPRKAGSTSPSTHANLGFNGAAAFQPRKGPATQGMIRVDVTIADSSGLCPAGGMWLMLITSKT